MKVIATEDAVGHVLVHDMTQIIPGEFKGVRFKKGHVVAPEDIEVLLSMGKEHLYVQEVTEGMVHEEDAAYRMAALCVGPHTKIKGEPHEGKLTIIADTDGVFEIDSARLQRTNAEEQVMIATRRSHTPVRAGDQLAGTRVIPLFIEEEILARVERAAGDEPLMRVAPYVLRRAAVIATGSEVKQGRIEDKFSPVIERKLKPFGITVESCVYPGDDKDCIIEAIHHACAQGVDLIVCTGGMSVDPDDKTPGAIRAAGTEVVTYGAPVLPGSMMLLGYLTSSDKRVCVLGLPGCVMYSKATIFDRILPRVAADITLTREDFVHMGEGGLCLVDCPICTFPNCTFGG